MGKQQDLWHDTLEDALRDAVHALGGPKAVGYMLWPDKSMIESAKYLNKCLDPERAEKLELSQLVMIMREAALKDCHTPMAFLADVLGYEMPRVKNPETERDRLQREFIHAQEAMATLVKKMERLAGKA